MISYDVMFEDWDGNPRTETYYFNVSETEVTLLNAKYGGSFANTLARLLKEKGFQELMDVLMDIVKTAYGRMDDDHVHFRKSEQIWEDWTSTGGFDKFVMRILGSDEETAKFIRGILPKSVRDAAESDEAKSAVAALQAADVTVT